MWGGVVSSSDEVSITLVAFYLRNLLNSIAQAFTKKSFVNEYIHIHRHIDIHKCGCEMDSANEIQLQE